MKKVKKKLSFTHRVMYINWSLEAETETVTLDEGKAKYKWLKEHGQKAISMTKRVDWLEENTYHLRRNGYWRSLTWFSEDKYHHWVWHSGDDSKNTGKFTNEGLEAIQAVHEHFVERTGKTFKKAFGYTEDHMLRQCVPKPLYYIQDLLRNVELKNISKADMSSHYPANICGALPDLHTAIKLEGEVEPNEEYPFAFYLGSGHCAEYQRFDTRKWSNYPVGLNLHTDALKRVVNKQKKQVRIPHYPNPCTHTLLCKASSETLTEEMLHYYALKRDGDPTAKKVMNAFIGYCHPHADRPSYRLHHLAAICIGRANQLMLETAQEIGEENVVQIISDAIIYIDEMNPIKCYSKDEKELGRFIKENDKELFKMIGTNQYMFINPETKKPTCITASGYNTNVENSENFDAMSTWRRE